MSTRGDREPRWRETEPRWVPSIYFTRAYGAATARESNASWATLSDSRGDWQIPVALTTLPGGGLDAVTPYGYAGIYLNKDSTEFQRQEWWRATIEELRSLDVVSLFLRFAPYDSISAEHARVLPGLELRHVSDTVGVPLANTAAVWDKMRGRARTAVRKALASGYTASVLDVDESLAVATHPFRRLYDGTMTRLGAARHYFFSDEYFRSLTRSFPDRLKLAQVWDDTGQVVAASLLLTDESIVHYHLSGSDPASARLGANNLMIWKALEWGAEHGLELMHLGGGTRPDDSLFKFKTSFGGVRYPYVVGSLVVDSERYSQLVATRAEALGRPESDLLASGYFPAYRAQL